MILIGTDNAHGLTGALEQPDWPQLTLVEVDALLRRYPQAGGAERLLSFSPRPFSAASVVAAPLGTVFVKRHPLAIRDRNGLLEEHRLAAHLARGGALVPRVLANEHGETAIVDGKWTYEVHSVAEGVDVYENALSWTPFLSCGHAAAAGRAMARMHEAAVGYDAVARKKQQLVSSFSIFADDDPPSRMSEYLRVRPLLEEYAVQRNWRESMDELLMPLHGRLRPWLRHVAPLWTHNDFHASNLMWSSAGEDAEVTGILDFGLADRTNAVHDLATAIERNIIEWLRKDEPVADLAHLDHLDSLLAGYEELRVLSYEEAQALVAMLPLVHCEFALSETDYFLSILHSKEKAALAYEGYFVDHARWFETASGRRLLEHLALWASEPRTRGDER
ncbi:phosphotransferase enzyme family protein [Acidicapsa ligni]|uniref:phosphotransferase enzyme family protein n=1 Tax=Acidicapsa ligni TaxID=542300 RepID=UPI0021DF47DE|nr:aminoglycoside phosphotransferase family protein [Acidicapsa ligni]